jgi:hypothetical protein
LLPVATMLEKLQFQQLIEEHVTIQRLTTSMSGFRFVLAIVLALYVGFSRLHHLQFLEREPMLTGILAVSELCRARSGDSWHRCIWWWRGNCWRSVGTCGNEVWEVIRMFFYCIKFSNLPVMSLSLVQTKTRLTGHARPFNSAELPLLSGHLGPVKNS